MRVPVLAEKFQVENTWITDVMSKKKKKTKFITREMKIKITTVN